MKGKNEKDFDDIQPKRAVQISRHLDEGRNKNGEGLKSKRTLKTVTKKVLGENDSDNALDMA